jgi:hypothetical protein
MCEHVRDKMRRTPPPPMFCKRPVPRLFRLLGLPKELRIMIYEQLGIITKHHIVPLDKKEKHNIITFNPSVPVRILATCLFINEEAEAILKPKIAKMLQSPPTIIVGAKDLVRLASTKVSFTYHKIFLGNIL